MPNVAFGGAYDSHGASVKVVSIPEGRPLLVMSLGGEADVVSAVVHWLKDEKRSVPHLEKDCPWCDQPSNPKQWIPALIHTQSCARSVLDHPCMPGFGPMWCLAPAQWFCGAIEVPESGFGVIPSLTPGRLIALGRGEGKFRRKAVFRVFDNVVS